MIPGRLTPARVAATVLVVAIVIQWFPVNRSNPPVGFEVDPPADVHLILRRSCYDCHSSETHWPWYSRFAPASWLVARDVRRGREDLNFSEWPAFDFELQEIMLADIAKQIDQRKMPLPVYLAMHPEARLSEAERVRLLAWARGE